jgi:hypothetical protein
MKIGNKVGIVGLVMLGLAMGIAITPLNRTALIYVPLVLPWVTAPMLVFSWIKGSRWWLTLPLPIIVVWTWAIARGI